MRGDHAFVRLIAGLLQYRPLTPHLPGLRENRRTPAAAQPHEMPHAPFLSGGAVSLT